MKRICVFDVNETLLDLKALDDPFSEAFGDVTARQEWFQQLLQSAFVSLVTDRYADFSTLGKTALQMTAEKRGRTLSDPQVHRIAQAMTQLPAHPDVKPGLERLRVEGFRLATLTNSTLKVAEAQLEYAGLRPYFEQVLSADEVKRLKPAPEPYRMAAERFGVPITQIRLVAAHAWDVAGALRAGASAAFIARPGKILDPLAERPDVIGRDLREVAAAIVEREGTQVRSDERTPAV